MLWGFQPEPPAPGPRSRLPGEGPGPHPHPGPSSPVTSKRPSRSRPGRAATSKDNGECAQEPPLRPHGEGPATRRATARGLSPPPWLTALRSRRTLRAAGANTGCGEAPGWALGKPPPGLTPLRVGRAGTTQGRGRSTKGCSARTAAVAAVRHLTHCLEQAPSATAPPGRHSSGRADPDATGWGGSRGATAADGGRAPRALTAVPWGRPRRTGLHRVLALTTACGRGGLRLRRQLRGGFVSPPPGGGGDTAGSLGVRTGCSARTRRA